MNYEMVKELRSRLDGERLKDKHNCADGIELFDQLIKHLDTCEATGCGLCFSFDFMEHNAQEWATARAMGKI